MRYLMGLLLLSLTLTGYCQKKRSQRPPIETDKKDYGLFGRVSNLSPETRLKNYPFNNAIEIRLVSFDGGGQIDDSLKIKKDMPNQRTYLTVLPFVENKKLTRLQVDQLTDIFMNYGYIRQPTVQELTKCYDPRNGILFLDTKGKVFEFIEICYGCDKAVFSHAKMLGGELDRPKIKLLKTFFQNVGIEYGITKKFKWQSQL